MVNCPVCNSSIIRLRNTHSARYLYCVDCGLLWREHGQDFAEFEDYYTSVNPTDSIGQSKENLYDGILAEAEDKLGGTGRVLDVGCGHGAFLEVAGKRGWETYGIEPVNQQADVVRGKSIPVHEGTLADIPGDIGTFDLITFWDVLMLVENPEEDLKTSSKLLTINGMIYCRVRQHKVVRFLEGLWKIFGRVLNMKNPAVYQPFNFEPGTIRTLGYKLDLTTVIANGKLTSGDAYGVSQSGNLVARSKKSLDSIIGIISRFSNDSLIISPTMDVWFTQSH